MTKTLFSQPVTCIRHTLVPYGSLGHESTSDSLAVAGWSGSGPIPFTRNYTFSQAQRSPLTAILEFMALSWFRLRWILLTTTIKATLTHFLLRRHPSDWNISFHIQFAILKRLKEITQNWTMEEVIIVTTFHGLTLQVKAFSVKYLPEPKNGWIIPLTIDVDLAEDSTIIAELGRVAKKVGPEFEISTPELEPVKVEWQGTGLNPSEEPTPFSGPVVLHLHGGGYISGSAATERTATLRLAELSGSRVLSVDYRLSPQYIFPAALLDAIIAYKFLVQPNQGATHSAVDPGKLIIAGDSAGVPFP
jgi:hypothetical protein